MGWPMTSCSFYTYVPDLIRYYLNEEPLLANVETPSGSRNRTSSSIAPVAPRRARRETRGMALAATGC